MTLAQHFRHAEYNLGSADVDSFEPMPRERLPDRLARRIRLLIQSGAREQGDRLPAIGEMARRFGVGHQSVREALKKLETMGVVQIRHGSGVYVSRNDDVLVVATTDQSNDVSEKTLMELLRARMPLETQSAADAAKNATPEQLREMRAILAKAAAEVDDEELNTLNMAFHRMIVVASGNGVLTQLVDVLQQLFGNRQRLLIGITGSRAHDHEEHVAILEAIELGDGKLAHDRMQEHLQGVQDAVMKWEGKIPNAFKAR